ncbi:hypothetical protein C1H46_008510 [Malus baccata]|uniref:poly(A)-specific ribonuclease n=1 Tax=Malus baccata TaxID=106549 RepID=A0A540N437_MALBA|nr:hypothetical protein C1H46_008510 [Malus baccata]
MANRFTAVWADNFAQEIAAVDRFLTHFPIVSFDTEFPGFLRNTPRSASDALRYQDLRFNVDSLKLIQLGITLFDDLGNIGGTWEFNFRGFDEETDPHVADSITLLKANGLDLEKFRKFGIDPEVFEEGFAEVLRMHRGRLLWVSFHGLYDSAYVMKLMTRKAMPSSPTEFAAMAGNLFERVCDLKFMAKFYQGLLGGEIGLERMAKILRVQCYGDAHQAGSDSLLTADAFVKMRAQFGLKPGMYEGFLYGLSPKICASSDPSSVHRVRAPPGQVILVPVVPTRPVILVRRSSSSSRDQSFQSHHQASPMLYPYPSPAPMFMHRPMCIPFHALPQAPPCYQIHM